MANDPEAVWIFADTPAALAELAAAGRQLARMWNVELVLVSNGTGQAQAAVDRCIVIQPAVEAELMEGILPTLESLVRERQPRAVLVGSSARGKAVAGMLAARLNQSAVADVQEFSQQGDDLLIRHLIYGGGAERVEKILKFPLVATLSPGAFDADLAQVAQDVPVETVQAVPDASGIHVRTKRKRQAVAVDLSSARRIVCVGRGLSKQEDLGLVNRLAAALGAEVACTRPVAEGLEWLPRERYIGISGATVKPDLYFGVGVSGQVQHAIGMHGARLVVAINKDAQAPIAGQADIFVEGDLYAVVPALLELLGVG